MNIGSSWMLPLPPSGSSMQQYVAEQPERSSPLSQMMQSMIVGVQFDSQYIPPQSSPAKLSEIVLFEIVSELHESQYIPPPPPVAVLFVIALLEIVGEPLLALQ